VQHPPPDTFVPNDPDQERQAAVLSDIRKTMDELTALRRALVKMKGDLDRETDRVTMVTADRDHWQADALKLRKLLIELATQMSNIGLLTIKAQEIVQTVGGLDKPEIAEAKTIPPASAL